MTDVVATEFWAESPSQTKPAISPSARHDGQRNPVGCQCSREITAEVDQQGFDAAHQCVRNRDGELLTSPNHQ